MKQLCIFVILCTLSIDVTAQSTGARAMGMGGCALSLHDGIEYSPTNPANAYAPSSSILFCIGSVNFNVGNSSLDVRDFNRYFTNTATTDASIQSVQLSNQERDQLFNLLSGTTISAHAQLLHGALIVALDPDLSIGLASSTKFQIKSVLPGNLLSLVDGSIGTTNVELRNAEANLLVYSEMQVSCSYRIISRKNNETNETLRAGLALKRIQGVAFSSLDPGSTLSVQSYVPSGWDSTRNLIVRMAISNSTAGVMDKSLARPATMAPWLHTGNNGYGFDVGLNYTSTQGENSYSYALALTDVGYIQWTSAQTSVVKGSDTLESAVSMDSQYFNRFTNSPTIGPLRSALAMRLQLGASARMPNVLGSGETVQVITEYTQGLNRAGSNTLAPRFACGAELLQLGYRPALRIGTHVGGFDSWAVSAGVGWTLFESVNLNAALGNLGVLVQPSKIRSMSGAASVTVQL